ncbi:TetR/AcrR family transcriptional regulator [Hyalangium gracile]|uniref:TetR/AcrR family transcriptional regulator n=1 Tax=Hyalangium gracile TaxID=394092 RepID=UPI001CCB4ABF|nr:TetR/AcrR family transcriptional regulator [Hyalangium gracile]
MTSKRMSKEQRRSQLLETASEIIRTEGTDALTLARVAERAGVTKPIAYEHFGTRSGLLIALFQAYDDRQTEAMRAALKSSGRSLEEVASIISSAYVDWEVAAGPEYGAIAAALSATEEMEEHLRACRDTFIAECRKAFAPFVKLPPQRNHAVLIGIIGAAEALSRAAATGRISRAEAATTLSRLMVGALRENAAAQATGSGR